METLINKGLSQEMIRRNDFVKVGKRPRCKYAIVETTPTNIIVYEEIEVTDIVITYSGKGYKEICPKTGKVRTRFNPQMARKVVESEILKPRSYYFGRIDKIVFINEDQHFINTLGNNKLGIECKVIVSDSEDYTPVSTSQEVFKNLVFLDMVLEASDEFIRKNYNDPSLKILWENEDNRILR